MITIDKLWESNNEHDWKTALEHYWSFVHTENIALERELNELKLEHINNLDQIGWYNFLHDKYFRWKYTAPNKEDFMWHAVPSLKSPVALHP